MVHVQCVRVYGGCVDVCVYVGVCTCGCVGACVCE